MDQIAIIYMMATIHYNVLLHILPCPSINMYNELFAHGIYQKLALFLMQYDTFDYRSFHLTMTTGTLASSLTF